MTRTMTASIAKYSAMPAQTPAIMRSSADLYRRRGPGSGEEWAAPPVGTSPAVVGASEGSAPPAAGVVGSESPAGVPAGGGGGGRRVGIAGRGAGGRRRRVVVVRFHGLKRAWRRARRPLGMAPRARVG